MHIQRQDLQNPVIINGNLSACQELVLEANNPDLDMNDRVRLLSMAFLMGGQQLHETNTATRNEVADLRASLSVFQQKDRERISQIVERAISEYQGRGIASCFGVGATSLGMLAASVACPVLILPTLLAATTTSLSLVETSEREFQFEQKLRKLKEEKHFENSGLHSTDIEKKIEEMKQAHNAKFAADIEAARKRQAESESSREVGAPW